MNAFPLAPFLIALAADGIVVTLHDYRRIALVLQAGDSWTLARLRGVLQALLVSNEEQAAIYLRRFENFFHSFSSDTLFPQLDLERALQELRTVAEQPLLSLRPAQQPPRLTRPNESRPTPAPVPYHHRIMTLCVALLCCWMTVLFWADRRIPPQGIAKKLTIPGIDVAPPVPSPKTLKIPLTPTPWPNTDLRTAALFAGALFILTLGYGVRLRRSQRIPQDLPPSYNSDGPRLFRIANVGGAPAPRLDVATLDHLADALGYFRSEQPSHHLNVPASIEATGRKSGIPTPVYYRRKQLRSVVVLEDQYSAALAWNPIATELAHGLSQRGVPVLFGRFRGSPQRFSTLDGTSYNLEDFEDERQGYLMLVFSDGKGLRSHEDAFVLEALARWPQVAWMELREPRAWDDSTTGVARAGLPVYPATRDGLLQVMSRFASEHGEALASVRESLDWRGLPPYQGTSKDALAAYVETLLGDALPWAQACALLQSFSLGIADAVRRQFCPTLPPERLERFFQLPGVTHGENTLQFPLPVREVLWRGFYIRWTKEQQLAIVDCLLAQLERAKPDQAEDGKGASFAQLQWQWTYEQVRLATAPERALAGISALAQTPFAQSIRAEMGNFTVADQVPPDTHRMSLSIAPQNKDALQRLARLSDNSGVAKLASYPIPWRRRMLFGALLLGFLASSGWGLQQWWETRQLPTNVTIEFVQIPAGEFRMGSTDLGAYKEEQPVHKVIISQPFYLGKTEVTQEQWRAVMGNNPSLFKGDDRPVEQVSWDDVQEFIRRLNDKEGKAVYRLPTEAEWEYAARAGSTTAFSFGDDSSQLGEYAWYSENSGRETHPVGSRKANVWGLYDMHGNVWEWVQDWYGQYTPETITDPSGPESGSVRVCRGGGWVSDARLCRSASRNSGTPDLRGSNLGFRLLRTAS